MTRPDLDALEAVAKRIEAYVSWLEANCPGPNPIRPRDNKAADLRALLAHIRELEGALAWVREVHPVTGRAIDGYPAKVTMTWRQFNEMRVALGMKPLPTKHDPRVRTTLRTTGGA